jgi:Tfp pilus assembly protein PilX
MPNKKIKFKGSAIAYGLVIMTVVSILLVSIIGYIISQLKFSSNRIEREKTFQVAEAGIYYYRWYLAHATDGMTAQQLKAFWQNAGTLGVSGDYTENYTDPETGVLIGTYTIHLDPPDVYSTIATVTSTGESANMSGVTRTVKARFRRPSWSEYMYIIDDFLNIGAGAEVFGRAHSNFGIRMDGIAHNSMTSLNPRFQDSSYGNRWSFGVHTTDAPADPNAPAYPWPDGTVPDRPDIFMGGRQFPVPRVDFNGVSADFTSMRNEATANGTNLTNHCTASGCYFDNTRSGRRITFLSNGTMDVCWVSAYDVSTFAITSYRRGNNSGNCATCTGQCAPQNYAIPNNGIIFVDNNVWTEGTINNKRVTVAADNAADTADIYIGMNNINYTNYDGRDVVGLIAKRNIAIVRDCQNNLRIDGALLAQTGKRFRDSGTYGCSYNKNSLTMNGALASFQQPYVNSGGCGFTTRTYNFDNNLLYYPPPFFPTGTEYAIDLWEEL